MKARVSPLTSKQRHELRTEQRKAIREMLDAERGLVITKLTLLACLAQHEEFGLGKDRLMRFISAFSKECAMQADFFEDGCGNEIMYKQARQIGLDALVEQIQVQEEAVKKYYKEMVK